jgi:hypothetical protein
MSNRTLEKNGIKFSCAEGARLISKSSIFRPDNGRGA